MEGRKETEIHIVAGCEIEVENYYEGDKWLESVVKLNLNVDVASGRLQDFLDELSVIIEDFMI